MSASEERRRRKPRRAAHVLRGRALVFALGVRASAPGGAALAFAGDPVAVADPAPPAVVVLAGGGREGEIGDRDAWSARLYRELLAPGDRTGDGRVTIALLAVRPQSEAMPEYFRWLGADVATNIIVDTPEAADDPALDERFAHVDAIFVKGGEQGRYYDCWNDRRIETCVRALVARGGGVGGTSAGAMALAEFALAGSMSLTAPDVLTDAHTPLLDDATDGGSGIQTDWFGFVPGALIDTHVTQRGRLGRTAGALARAIDDSGRADLLAIALDQQTGVVIRNGRATVVGRGAVEFLRPASTSYLRRTRGTPLVWTDLRLDRLTDGWQFDLTAQCAVAPAPLTASTPPLPRAPSRAGARPTPLSSSNGSAPAVRTPVRLRGECPDDERAMPLRLVRDALWFALSGVADAYGPRWLAVLDAHASSERAWAHEAGFAALVCGNATAASVAAPDAAGEHAAAEPPRCADMVVLCGAGGRVWTEPNTPSLLRFGRDPESEQTECAAIVIDATRASHRSSAAQVSLYDRARRAARTAVHSPGSHDVLRPATIVGARLHILADTQTTGLAFDLSAARVVELPRD